MKPIDRFKGHLPPHDLLIRATDAIAAFEATWKEIYGGRRTGKGKKMRVGDSDHYRELARKRWTKVRESRPPAQSPSAED